MKPTCSKTTESKIFMFRVDQRIKEGGGGATLEEGSQELVPAIQAAATPSEMSRTPPGMAVLDNPPTLAYSRLCLEKDFGWTGRDRMLKAGLLD